MKGKGCLPDIPFFGQGTGPTGGFLTIKQAAPQPLPQSRQGRLLGAMQQPGRVRHRQQVVEPRERMGRAGGQAARQPPALVGIDLWGDPATDCQREDRDFDRTVTVIVHTGVLSPAKPPVKTTTAGRFRRAAALPRRACRW